MTRCVVLALGCYLVLALAYQREPLDPYLDGYLRMQPGWNSFLLGQISETGFYAYFLIAWVLKTPPATALAVLLALVSLRRVPLRRGEGLLLAAAALFLAVSSILKINIGVRHILPACMLLVIFAGRLWLLRDSRPVRVLLPFLAFATMVEVALATPFHLSYFSSLAGGPWQGHRHLSDSNLDWGQDLKRLAEWARREQPEGLLFGVFTGADPTVYGLRYQPLPAFGTMIAREKPLEPFPKRFVVALSALNLQGVYFARPEAYQTLAPIDPTLYRFLLDRPPLERLTPSIWLWDITGDADALQRIALIYLNFRWFRSAVPVLERYLEIRPEDARTRAALERLRQDIAATAPPTQGEGEPAVEPAPALPLEPASQRP